MSGVMFAFVRHDVRCLGVMFIVGRGATHTAAAAAVTQRGESAVRSAVPELHNATHTNITHTVQRLRQCWDTR
ncbi:hypothetical protein J6590_087813 [Homalodisca vitripennis]|nr:hypothetical protein J6590_087813 [Homalodisca vitripennis]